MAKVAPAIVVLLGESLGTCIGAFAGHITLGSAIGGGIGFTTGLAMLLLMRSRRTA